jgi:hypothetical protein
MRSFFVKEQRMTKTDTIKKRQEKPHPLVLEKGGAHYSPHCANVIAFLCPAGGECCRRLSETARAVGEAFTAAQSGNINSAPK